MAVVTFNVRTLAMKSKDGYAYAECVLPKARRLVCDFISLQETKRLRKTDFTAAVYEIVCLGQKETEIAPGYYGVGTAVEESICRTSVNANQSIDKRVMSVLSLELTRKGTAFNLVVIYAS